MTKYSLTLKIGSEVSTSKGDTMLEAFEALTPPTKINTKGVITVKVGDKVKEMIFMPNKLRKLFYPNTRPVITKYLTYGM